MNFTKLDPRVAAFDRAVDAEIHGHPFGDTGGGDVSELTESENTGHLVDAMAARFAEADAARMKELNRLVKGLPPEPEEDEMAKVKRGDPKPCCGSRASRHTSTCKVAAKGAPPAAEPKPAPTRLAANKAGTGPDFSGYEVVQLLAIIVAAQAELELREQDLKEQLDAIRLARAG